MLAHDDEVSQHDALQQHGVMVEIAWRHLLAANERFVRDTSEQEDTNANAESNLALNWLQKYCELIG